MAVARNEPIVETSIGPSASGGPDSSWSLTEFYVGLKQDRRLIATVTIVCTLLATVAAFILPVKYTSTASLIPPSLGGGSSMASALAGQLATLGGAGDLLGNFKSSGDLYAGILKSRSIADALIDREHLMEVYRVKKLSDAERKIKSDTDIDVDQRSTIVDISVTERSPELAQRLTNDYLHALQETEGRLALTQAAQRAKFFSDQLEKEKNTLEDAEVDLKKIEEESGLIAPSGQTQSEIIAMANTQARIAAQEVNLASLQQSATDENPEVIRVKSEIDDLKGQLSRMESGNGKMGTLSIPASKVPALQLEYVRGEREVKYHEALFEILSRQYEAARLDEAKEAPELQIVDTASLPDTKSFPKRGYFVLGGFVVGLLAGIVWAFFRQQNEATTGAR
jgi:uncharacterized protein involved in exopolysaccharide biosynthesis